LAVACAAIGRCPTGHAVITPGFDLPARYVIHTVGPVWHGGGHGEAERLASAYRSSVVLAAEHGLRTIAFPAISCGIYGYPVEQAAAIAVEAVGGSGLDVTFALFSEDLLEAFSTAWRQQ
jgi:O-acetyl-ADP-ribose deacetylase (regulator of RNase III)